MIESIINAALDLYRVSGKEYAALFIADFYLYCAAILGYDMHRNRFT
ncbi:MAG: hypothetical protein OSJ56_07610 [Prevotella sp.]|nr:hypothetical protein [Prevotella sp.]